MRIADNVAQAPQLPLWAEPSEQLTPHVRHSLRARRVAVRVNAVGAVTLVIPRGVSERQARTFFESRADWVRHHVEQRRAQTPAATVFPPAVIEFALTGELWRVFQAGGTGRPRLREQGLVLELRGVGTREQWRRTLLRWLAQRAAREFELLLSQLATQHGFSFARVRIACQRTRWGSCSSRGVISLNLALLFQPPAVASYLLCHELAHTRHMNHSARFWQCVAQCVPNYRQLDAQLSAGWRRVPDWVRESP